MKRCEFLPIGAKRGPAARDVTGAAAGTFDYPVTRVGAAGSITVCYDPSLGTPGSNLANDLLGRVTVPYGEMESNFKVSGAAITVVVAPLSGKNDGSGGAYHYGCDFISGATLYLDATFSNAS